MDEIFEDIKDALYKEEKERAVRLALEGLDDKLYSVVDLYENVLKEVLYTISRKDSPQVIDIWSEHVITCIIRTIIEGAYLYLLEERDANAPDYKGKVMILCPEGEFHELGPRMASDYFTLLGYNSIFVGSSTPKEEVLKAVEKLDLKYVSISVSNYDNIGAARSTIRLIRKKASKDLKILVGGQVFIDNPDLAEEVETDMIVNSYNDIKGLHV